MNGCNQGTTRRLTLSLGVCSLVMGLLLVGQVSQAASLTVTVAGAGTGTVNSAPSGIACPPTCTASFTDGDTVTLTATPDWKSLFSGWGVPCSGSGTCVFTTINGSAGVSASFTPNYQATILGHSVVQYTSLTETYAHAAEGDYLAAHEYTFLENLTLDQEISVTFYGGMGDMYLANTGGFTTLQGTLDIQHGSLVADSLIIQ